MQFTVNISTLNVRLAPTTTSVAVATLSAGMSVLTKDEIVNDGRIIWREIIEPTIFAKHWAAERMTDNSAVFLMPVEIASFKGVRNPAQPPKGRVAIVQRENGFFLTIDGTLHRSIGVNVRELPWFGLFRNTNQSRWSAYAQKARDMGVRIIRYYVPLVDRSVEEIIARNRLLLDLLHQNGLMAIVVLNDALSHSRSWLRDEEQWHTGELGLLSRDYFEPANYTQFYLPLVERMAREFRDHPAILAWDLMNEPTLFFRREGNRTVKDTNVRDLDRENFIQFVKDAAAAIRNVDQQHLISLGLINTGQLGVSDQPRTFAGEIFRQLKGHLDFAQVHFYQKTAGDNDIWDEENRSRIDALAARDVSIPIVVGEFGSWSNATNRLVATENMFRRWLNDLGAALLLQWGFMWENFPTDAGIGDALFGCDPVLDQTKNSTNRFVFEGLVNLYQRKNVELGQQT